MKKETKPPAIRLDGLSDWCRTQYERLPRFRKRVGWREIARPEQLRPKDCVHWLYLAGRGAGKTRAAAERIRERIESGEARYIALIGASFADVRDIMVEGESGLKSVAGGLIHKYNRSIGEITFRGGAKARFFSGEDPEGLRGWQSTDVWGDELCAWRFGQATFDMAMFGLRLGSPEAIWTTTPKNQRLLLDLIRSPNCKVTRSSTKANAANLAKTFLESIVHRYEGTALGRQELEGEILEETPGSLWRREWFDREGFRLPPALTRLNGKRGLFLPKDVQRIVVGLDPSVGDPARRRDASRPLDECGLVVAGADANGHGYVLGDFTHLYSPSEWARVAVDLFSFCKANLIVAEANQGGAMVAEMIRGVSSNVPVQSVHAMQGKRARAEPVANLYEQGRIHHCGAFDALEDQMVNWDAFDLGQPSPNNIDALVWAFHGLGLCEATGVRAHDRIQLR